MKIKIFLSALLFSFLFVFPLLKSEAADVNCHCAKWSPAPFSYPNVGEPLNTASDNDCNQECANRGAEYYSYSNLANVGYTSVTKKPGGKVNTTKNTTAASFDYIPLEKIPGSDAETSKAIDFYDYINAVYKFGIWAVGIVALFMLVFGGYTYITSAGNNSSMETAKKIITDAIVGIIMALTAYLLLYVINPDLVKIKKLTPLAGIPTPGVTVTPIPGSAVPGAGTCAPVTVGDCSINNLQNGCLGSTAETMSRICSIESEGNPAKISGTDKCKDGNYFSIGLFQINMITSAGSIGCDGKEIFTVNGSNSGNCLQQTTNSGGVSYCAVRDCQVKDMAKYNECLNKLKNGATSINIACDLSSNGSNLNPWLTTKKRCGL